jgi:hypothetical protein
MLYRYIATAHLIHQDLFFPHFFVFIRNTDIAEKNTAAVGKVAVLLIVQLLRFQCGSNTVLCIRIRKDPKLFAGSGSVTILLYYRETYLSFSCSPLEE